jgi:signal transduction histidine kinase
METSPSWMANTCGLIASERQAIDATLRSLTEEDPRFRHVADRYWNARGGSYTDGGAFVFTVNTAGKNTTLSCADKFGKPISAPAGKWRTDPDSKATISDTWSARIANGLSTGNANELFGELTTAFLSWDLDQVSVAIERARLGEQSIEHARADERARIAREVHDTLAQEFTAVGLHIESGLSHLEPRNRARPALTRALGAARQGLDEARRSISSLRASPLENRSLAEALGALSRRFTAETGVRVRVDIADVGAIPADVESEVFRIAGEALTNVRKHAGAREATLRLEVVRRRLRLTIADAGAGFRTRGARGRGFGLSGIEDRARAVAGRATIRSAPGRGTTVTVTIPLQRKDAEDTKVTKDTERS